MAINNFPKYIIYCVHALFILSKSNRNRGNTFFYLIIFYTTFKVKIENINLLETLFVFRLKKNFLFKLKNLKIYKKKKFWFLTSKI